jgi:hypothetical protein
VGEHTNQVSTLATANAAQVLAGEAWLVLPTWQLAAICISGLPPSQPIRLVFDDSAVTGQPDLDDGDFTRERDDQVPVAYWNSALGQLMPPLAKPPLRQAQARAAVTKG